MRSTPEVLYGTCLKYTQLGCILEGAGPWLFYTCGKTLVRRMSYRGKLADYEMRVALSYFGPMRVELIQRPAGRMLPEKIFPVDGPPPGRIR